MATSHEATVKKVQYKNWIKSGLALKYLKEGLQPFVTDVIKHQHERIVGSLLPCCTCSLWTLLPHHAAKVGRNCSLGRAKCLCIGSKHTIRTHCPTNVCGRVYDKIVDSHFFGDPNFTNTDITKWVTEPWELAKAYINAWGYKDQKSAEDTDCLGLLSIIINDLEFHGHLSVHISTNTTDTFSKVRQYRNDIMHSSNLEVTDANLNTYVTDMDTILDDPTRLRNEHYAQEARTKLQQLLENDIYISTSDEISLIREAQRSLERNNNIQADSLHDIAQSLDKMKEENQERFESIDKAQVSLRKAINDINNKSIDQQKLASDLQQVKIDLESMNNEAKLDRKSMTDRIGIIENTLKEVDSLLQKMVSEKNRKKQDKKYKEQLDYLEKKNALKVRLFEMYEMHLSTVPISPILEEMRSHIGEIYVDVVICDHLLKEQVGEQPENIRRSRATGTDSKGRKVKSYNDIFFKNGEQCLNIYILGDAGMGKTTWCMKLVNDWVKCSRDQSIQTEKLKGILWYELIILVFLRNATQEVNIIDMIKEQLFSENTELYEIFVDVLRKEPDKCLVIVDGLDEWIMPQVTKSLTQNQGIPSKAGLNGCPLLITTRPSKIYDIRLKETQFDRCIKIEGVKDKDKLADKLIKELNKLHGVKVPKQFADFKKSYEGLFPELSICWFLFESTNPVIKCMENPLLLIISVCIWFQYGKIEKTLAGNYSDMFRYLFEYTLKMKQFNINIPIPGQASKDYRKRHLLPECLCEKIPMQFVELMSSLAKFAFESMFNDSERNESKLVFAEEKLKSWFTDFELQAAVNCGILSKSYAINQPLTRMTKMSFLHKSFQEFLSAVHIVGQFQNKNEDPLKQYQNYCSVEYKLFEMENVLLFVCGLDPRAASKMSLTCQRKNQSVFSYDFDGQIFDLLLKCTMQVHRFSKVYPSAEYPIYIETIKLNLKENDWYFGDMDYISYLLSCNITNIKHIKINGVFMPYISIFKNIDHSQFLRNFFSCGLPLSVEKCSLQDIDLSGFTDWQLDTFRKWFEKLTKLESLKMINVRLPCNFTLCLKNCRQLKTLELRDIYLLDIKINFQNMESIDLTHCPMNLSPEDAYTFDTQLTRIVLSLSGKYSTAGNPSVSDESEKRIIAENMFRISVEKCYGFSLKFNPFDTTFSAQLKQNNMQRKDIEHLVKMMKVQCLVLNSSDQLTELRSFFLSRSFNMGSHCKLNSLRMSNASVLETEHLIKHALSSKIMKCVCVSTEIIENRLVLDLVSCRHLELLEIKLSEGQLESKDIVKILECAQLTKRLLRLKDNRVSFELKYISETKYLLRSHNHLKLTCFNTNRQETENVVRFTVNNLGIKEFSLLTESIEYDTLLRSIECKHLNEIVLILSNINFNQLEKEEVATKLLQNYSIFNGSCVYLKICSEDFIRDALSLVEHSCRREKCCEIKSIFSDDPDDFQKVLRILSLKHMHLSLKSKHKHNYTPANKVWGYIEVIIRPGGWLVGWLVGLWH